LNIPPNKNKKKKKEKKKNEFPDLLSRWKKKQKAGTSFSN